MRVTIREKPETETALAPPGRAQQSETLHATGHPPGGSYAWQVDDGGTVRITGSGPTASVLGLQAGTTRARVTYTLGGQSANDDTGIRVVPRVDPTISPSSTTVLVRKDHTNPVRQTVTLGCTDAYGGSGTFTRSSDAVRFFTAANGGAEITFDGADNVFTGAQLQAGVQVFAEGQRASAALDDITLGLALSGGPENEGPDASATITSVELTLDVCMSRTTHGTDPAPLSEADKINTGRFVHIQDTGNHHGRAMLIVRKAAPAAFAGTLEVRPVSGAVTLFDVETGGAALPNPHPITNSSIGANGVKLWAEGAVVSGALRDTGFQLGVRNVDPAGDRVAMTTMRLRRLVARVDSTRANRVRMGNFPGAHRRAFLRRGTTANPDPTNYDQSFTNNPPLVLIEGSVLAAKPVQLSVQVQPAGVPVSWVMLRDQRPAPDGDHASIVGLSAATPTLTTPVAGDPLKATLVTDSVGSFHICPYVDCNGNNTFDFDNAAGNRIDREPHLFMNLVLVRVQGRAGGNRSRCRNSQVTFTPAAPTAATGVGVSTGSFATGPTAACHNDAWVDVIGGGGNGRRGLNRLFGGWINNEQSVPTSPTVPRGEDVVCTYRGGVPPANHTRVSVWQSGGAGTVFAPAGGAPALVSGPVLDTTNFANPGTGGNRAVGTEGAIGPPTPITKVNGTTLAATLGQRWRVQMWDSPGDNCPSAHGFHPGTLRNYRFNLNFRSDLCFWTSTGGTPNATGHAACRLYASVVTNTWTIRIAFTFHAVTGAGANTSNRIRMRRDPNATRTATAVEGSGVEVRAPIALNLLGIDARA